MSKLKDAIKLAKVWKGIGASDAFEFAQKSSKLREIRHGMPKDEVQKKFADFIDSLSDSCFYAYGKALLMTIKPTEENSKKYNNTEEEVQGFFAWCPRYAAFKDDVDKMIREWRLSIKLEA